MALPLLYEINNWHYMCLSYFDFILCSISKMTSLKQIDLSYNDLSGDERLSEKLSALANLEILVLRDCSLKEIPDR